jgi:hypothetical protein
MRPIVALVVSLCLLIPAIPASAHGTSKIIKHRISQIDGTVKVRGIYRVSNRHEQLVVSAFIIQRDRVIAEKTRRDSGRRIRIRLRAECRAEVPVYAIIQGDTRRNGHFAIWNSRTIVCKR